MAAVTVSELQARLGVDQASRAKFNRDLADADSRMERTSKTGSRAFAALGRAAKAGFLVAGAATVAGAGYSIKAASDLGESMNAINVVFGKASKTIFDFGKTAATSAGLSQRAFNEAVTPIGAALQNVGYNAQQAADKSVMLTQRAADMASVFNTDLSESLGAIQAGLRGELDPLEKFGVSLNEAALQSYAVKAGIAKANTELNASQKVQARLGLIMQQTNKVQGDFANTSGGLANQQRILKANLENTAAAFGRILLPAAVKVVNFANDHLVPMLDDLAGFVSRLSRQKTWTMRLRVAWEGISGLVEKILFGTPAQRIKVPIDQRHFEWQTTTAGVGLLDVIQEAIETADYSGIANAMADGIGEAFHRAASKIPATPQDFLRAIGIDPDRDYNKELGHWLDKQIARAADSINPANWHWDKLGEKLSDELGFDAIAKQARGMWKTVREAGQTSIDFLQGHWQQFVSYFGGQVGTLVGVITGGWKDIRQAFVDAFDRIRGKADDVLDKVRGWWNDARDAVQGAIDKVRSFFQWIQNGVDKIAGPLGKVADIFGDIKSGIGRLNPFGDGIVGAGIGGAAGASISSTLYDDIALGQSMGLAVTSGYRPGAITSTGNPSLHGVYPAKAVDLAGSESAMRAFFLREVVRAPLTGIRELIHSPYWWHPGSGITRIPASAGSVLRDHYNHVHVGSYDQGGFLKPGWNLAYNGLGRPERVGGGDVHVYVDGSVLTDGRDLATLIRKVIERYEQRN